MSNNGNCGRPWTPYEDDLLRAAVVIHGDNTEKWKTIALSVPGRTNKACRKVSATFRVVQPSTAPNRTLLSVGCTLYLRT